MGKEDEATLMGKVTGNGEETLIDGNERGGMAVRGRENDMAEIENGEGT